MPPNQQAKKRPRLILQSAQAPPPLKRAVLVTYGLSECPSLRRHPIDTETCKLRIAAIGGPEVDYIIDTRNLKPPKNVKRITGHLGTHPQIMTQIVAHPNFGQVWNQFRAAEIEAGGNLNVALICKAGTHRSVAVEALGNNILTRSGYETRSVHLMTDHWEAKTCNGCGSCSLSNWSQTRETAFQKAWSMW